MPKCHCLASKPVLIWRGLRIGPPHLVGLGRCDPEDTPDVALLHQLAAACHADIQIGDLLAQSIAVNPQQIGTFGLIAGGSV